MAATRSHSLDTLRLTQSVEFIRGDTNVRRVEVSQLDARIHLKCVGKNVRHNLHWNCRDAPISSWHSATCFHTKLPNILSYPATVSQSAVLQTSHVLSTLLQAFKTHRSLRKSVCVLQLATQDCTTVLSMGQTQSSEKENTHGKFLPLEPEQMATHTRVRALARHANKNETKLSLGCSIPNSPEHANSKCW